MLLGRWIGRSLRGDLEIVFLLYWVMRILFAEMCRAECGSVEERVKQVFPMS